MTETTTATQDTETLARDVYAGYAPSEGGHVYLTIELRHRRRDVTLDPEDPKLAVGGFQTVDHCTVEWHTELSITGTVAKGTPTGAGPDFQPSRSGQCRSAVTAITRGPLKDLGLADELNEVWRRWHLNGLKAGCIHQDVVWESTQGYRRPDLENTPACPQTGYRYGRSWLVEELPAEVEEFVRDLARRLAASQEG
jgi:hypothetical protein